MPIAIPYNAKLGPYAKKLRKAGILSEVILWNQLKRKKMNGMDFDRQRVIGNYIADFCCKENGVVVEIDGWTHDYKVEYDKQREEYLKSLGLETIHVSDSDVKRNLKGVMDVLRSHPLLQVAIPERKCIFIAKLIPPPASPTPPKRGIVSW